MRMLCRIAIVCSALLLATACSPVKKELKPVKLEKLEPSYSFKREWSKKVGSGRDERYVRLQPYIENGVVYTVDPKGRVTALDAANGNLLWQTELAAEVSGGVGNGGELVLVGGLQGEVYALDKSEGRVLWQSRVSSEILAAPESNGKVVVTPAIDGRVFAFDAADGAQIWSYDHPTPVLSLRSNASPLMVGNAAYLGFDNGQLLRFDSSNGHLRWSARVGQPQGKTEIERLVDVDTTPIAIGPLIYTASVNGRLVAVNPSNGRITWAQELSTHHNIGHLNGNIAVTTDNGHVKLFDARAGTELWQNEKLHRRETGAPVVMEEMVLVTDHEGYLHGLSIDSGELVARRKLGSRASAQPLVAEGVIYIYDDNGRLAAYSLKPEKPGRGTRAPDGHDD